MSVIPYFAAYWHIGATQGLPIRTGCKCRKTDFGRRWCQCKESLVRVSHTNFLICFSLWARRVPSQLLHQQTFLNACMHEQELNLPALGCQGLCIQQTNKRRKLRGDRQAPSFYEENPLVGKGQQWKANTHTHTIYIYIYIYIWLLCLITQPYDNVQTTHTIHKN